jgi:hypothetical protein
MSFRRQVLIDVGGFNSYLTYNYDDVEICSRIVDKGYGIHLVDHVLVRHYRAANPARGGDQAVRDPYPGLYCRCVFAMHCHQPERTPDEIVASIRAAEYDMLSLGDRYLAQGTLTPGDHDTFVYRARSAVKDGFRVGSKPRPTVSFATSSANGLRPYR